jgi:hypothetical protein
MDDIPPVHRAKEKIIHKYPSLDNCIYIAHPYGKQCYAWFTKGKCVLIDLYTKKRKEINMNVTNLDGTLMFGTIVYNDHPVFLIDDIYYYKNESIQMSYLQKRDLFIKILTLHIQNHGSSHFFMLPLMSKEPTTFHTMYKMYSVKIIHSTCTYHYIEQNPFTRFTIRPTSKSDIYELYQYDKLHSIAYIDTYKCSLWLSTLFYGPPKIEESDDECEPVKELMVDCKWNDTFKKWTPVKVI